MLAAKHCIASSYTFATVLNFFCTKYFHIMILLIKTFLIVNFFSVTLINHLSTKGSPEKAIFRSNFDFLALVRL